MPTEEQRIRSAADEATLTIASFTAPSLRPVQRGEIERALRRERMRAFGEMIAKVRELGHDTLASRLERWAAGGEG